MNKVPRLGAKRNGCSWNGRAWVKPLGKGRGFSSSGCPKPQKVTTRRRKRRRT